MILRFKLWLAGVAAIAAAFFITYMKGRKDQEDRYEFEDAEAYRETRNRIDEAGGFDDAGRARDWLRERQSKR